MISHGNMGEIDTKPIESVQAALSLFGEKGDQKKHRTSSSEGESDELQILQKELANYKVQLEAKESSHMQDLLKLQQYEEQMDELSNLLMRSELERDRYIEEYREAESRADELEFKLEDMADQVLEMAKVREQVLLVVNQLSATQAELLGRETELASAREIEGKAIKRAELMEMSAAIERQKAEELLKHAEELGETILELKAAAVEAENERSSMLSEKEQLKDMNKHVELIGELENQLRDKSRLIESLHRELDEKNRLLSTSEQAKADAMMRVETLMADLEVKERTVSESTVCIEEMEMELIQLKLELSKANENIDHLVGDIEVLMTSLDEVKSELAEVKESENDAQVEVAMLKAELHKAMSSFSVDNVHVELQKAEAEMTDFTGPNLNIPSAIYEARDQKLADEISAMEEADHMSSSQAKQQVEALEKELESAMARIGEFRTRAEQAISRAESAEKAKLALDEQLRKRQKHKQRRKAALAELREESISRKLNPPCPPSYDKTVLTHPPLDATKFEANFEWWNK